MKKNFFLLLLLVHIFSWQNSQAHTNYHKQTQCYSYNNIHIQNSTTEEDIFDIENDNTFITTTPNENSSPITKNDKKACENTKNDLIKDQKTQKYIQKIDIFDEFTDENEKDETENEMDMQIQSNTRTNNKKMYNETNELENSTGSFIEVKYAKIAILDKSTSKRYVYTIETGESIEYYDLSITVKKCIKNISPFANDDMAFLLISSKKDPSTSLFSSWISKKGSFTSNIHKSHILIAVLECIDT